MANRVAEVKWGINVTKVFCTVCWKVVELFFFLLFLLFTLLFSRHARCFVSRPISIPAFHLWHWSCFGWFFEATSKRTVHLFRWLYRIRNSIASINSSLEEFCFSLKYDDFSFYFWFTLEKRILFDCLGNKKSVQGSSRRQERWWRAFLGNALDFNDYFRPSPTCPLDLPCYVSDVSHLICLNYYLPWPPFSSFVVVHLINIFDKTRHPVVLNLCQSFVAFS